MTENSLAALPEAKHDHHPESAAAQADPRRKEATHAQRAATEKLLERLAARFPRLFGASPAPLQRGIFDALTQALPDVEPQQLKDALGRHTRSSRYLLAVASGQPRHNLEFAVTEPMAIEHSFHALTELYRRKLRKPQRGYSVTAPGTRGRQTETPAQWLTRRLQSSIAKSGLGVEAYRAEVHTRDADILAILDSLGSAQAAQQARDEAMLRAFEASACNIEAFAEMYGLSTYDAKLVLARAELHEQRRQSEQASAQADGG